jgi:adenylylsulfate kinase
MGSNIVWHKHRVTKEKRLLLTQQNPCILWFTGLSGSGKSTLAGMVEQQLYENGNFTYLLDGDNLRYGLNSDLGFDEVGRKENIRRIGEVAKLFVDSGLIVLTAFISPYVQERDFVRNLVKHGEFIEIFVDVPLTECEKRDPKGLYKKARSGEIKDFTGVSAPYEEPENPDIYIFNNNKSVEENAKIIINYLIANKYIKWRNK